MGIRIKQDETIVFIGDSITDCGRRGPHRPLGQGYVKVFADLVMIREPRKRIKIINRGISGNRVTNLQQRWGDDVLRHRPQWLAIMIGINDLHSFLNGSPDSVPPGLYREVYTDILSRTREALPACRVFLLDPFYISTETSATAPRGRALRLLREYLAVVHALSREYDTGLVRTQRVFQRLLKYHDSDVFCPEPVHPYPTGHRVIAEAVYDALGK